MRRAEGLGGGGLVACFGVPHAVHVCGTGLGSHWCPLCESGGLTLGGEDSTPDVGELISQVAPYRALAIWRGECGCA